MKLILFFFQQHLCKTGKVDAAGAPQNALRRPAAGDPGADVHHQGGHERAQPPDRTVAAGKPWIQINADTMHGLCISS